MKALYGDYTGYKTILETDPDLPSLYKDKTKNLYDLLENQYLVVLNDKDEPVDRYKWQDGKHKQIYRKPVESMKMGKLKPKNLEQECAIDMLMDPSITVKVMTGGYGAGKAQPNSTKIPTPNGYISLGDLKPGDLVYNLHGEPVKILSVHPQGKIDNYKISFCDGRYAYCNDQHIWSCLTSKGNLKEVTVEQMISTGIHDPSGGYKYYIPPIDPIQYPEKHYHCHPYVLGALLGDGCCRETALSISSNDEFVVRKIADLIHAVGYGRNHKRNYTWSFYKQTTPSSKRFSTKEVLPKECVGLSSGEKYIPEEYKFGSIEQRLQLLQGLFDTDGSVALGKGRVSFSTTSRQLADDVVEVLRSIGFSPIVGKDSRVSKYRTGECFNIMVYGAFEAKQKLFTLPRKRNRFLTCPLSKYRRKGCISITDIEKIGQEEMTCLYIDDPDHIYITEQYLPTHNTIISTACAFQLLQSGDFDKIMWVRNNIEVKDSKSIGYLPGTYNEKMNVWAMPLADHLQGKEQLDLCIQRGLVEVEHLGFLRGRDIKRTIVFCSEAEHLTREHVQLLLGRIAEGSILILEGDCRQMDAKAFEEDNGLVAAINRLKGNRLFGYVNLRESVRSETAKLADLLD